MSRLRSVQMRLMSKQSMLQERHQNARNNFQSYMQEKLDHFYVEVDPGPTGDAEIIKRTAILSEKEVDTRTSTDFYFYSGYGMMLKFLKIGEQYGLNLRTLAAIFELGCGSARLIRHLRCIDGVRLVGSDVEEDFITWCRTNVPGVEFYANDYDPPLAFAEPNSFDLAFAQSVFTHIPLETQAFWIAEMHRVVRPGGMFICTVLGRKQEQKMLTADQSEELRRDGQITLDATHSQASYSTQLIGSWDVFQTRAEVLDAFGAYFDVLDYVPGDLDVLVMKKL